MREKYIFTKANEMKNREIIGQIVRVINTRQEEEEFERKKKRAGNEKNRHRTRNR